MCISRTELEGGKYTVLNNNGVITALRYGKPWRDDLVGDGLVLALVQRIEELEEGVEKAFERGYQVGIHS